MKKTKQLVQEGFEKGEKLRMLGFYLMVGMTFFANRVVNDSSKGTIAEQQMTETRLGASLDRSLLTALQTPLSMPKNVKL